MLDSVGSGASVKLSSTRGGGRSSDAPAAGSEPRTSACAPAPAAVPASHNAASVKTSSGRRTVPRRLRTAPPPTDPGPTFISYIS